MLVKTRQRKNLCVHELFEAQVRCTPHSTAVVYEQQHLSYGELNERANRLAHHLRSLGVKPDTRVAICVERSLEMVVGLLAILKAGGAYVPLDLNYPPERLAYMLADSTPRVVLTHGEVSEEVWAVLGAMTLFDLQADADRWSKCSTASPRREEIELEHQHLAYVIYTSGSTGRPKGVMVEHRSVVNHIDALQSSYELHVHDRVVQFAAVAFDVSVEEIFRTLSLGAALVLRTDAWLSADSFCALCAAQSISVANLPTLFWQAIAHLDRALPACLREIIIGGDTVSPGAIAAWFKRTSHRPKLTNAYGPTETTIDALIQELQSDAATWGSIGRPIANTCIYILDRQGQPVPTGGEGELYIGGVGVARGYLNRPELTAECFMLDPFAADGSRMYRSGDLGRYLPNGEIEFIGRADFQVKLRGFRIEPGEIETCLSQYPRIKEAVVIAREDVPGDKRLVAYLTHTEAGPSVEELRTHLQALLPEYMIPSAFVTLQALPLTANGKLDRKALPAPDLNAFSIQQYEAPHGEIEAKLAAIWQELLQVQRVGRQDHFFKLGGHSLLAVQLVGRMRQQGLHVDVRALFTHSTLAELAAEVGKGEPPLPVPANRIPMGCTRITPDMLSLIELSEVEIGRIVATVPGGSANIQDIYPLAPLQDGVLFHYLMSRESDPYLLSSLMAFDTRERLERFLTALQAVIDRHDILRTGFCWDGLREPVQVVWRRARLAVEEVQLPSAANGIDAASLLRQRFDPRRYRLDIHQAPLMRVVIARDEINRRELLLLLNHHLVDDQTTLRAMVEEVQAHLRGEAQSLPAPLPFRNFVAQARQGISQEEHEAFFRQMLAEVEEPTAPFGLLDVQGDGGGIVEARQVLSAGLARRLHARALILGVSVANLCHLAWARVLARTCGREDVVFGTVLFGRMQGGADRALGMFVNTLPVRIRCDTDSVEQGVHATHALLAQLMRHEHAPLVLAQRCSAVQAPHPLFSTLLNCRHNPLVDPVAHADWTGIEFLSSEDRTNYPLTLSVDDVGEDIMLTAQAVLPLVPQHICTYMETALEQLVDALERAPHTPLHTIDILPAADKRLLLQTWNATRAECPQDHCIHQLFEARVVQMPDAIALVYEEQRLSYEELNRCANQLAHYLRGLGVGPDIRVALCVERSLEVMIGVLAILKAGGAYVPLDPAYPRERLAYMLEDSAPAVLLTQGMLAERCKWSAADFPVLLLDQKKPAWADQPQSNPDPVHIGLHSRCLAYVIYTSGSTGKPKGVMVEHRAILNHTLWQCRTYDFSAADRFLQRTSLSFDAAGWELWSSLTVGACVVLASEGAAAKDPEVLVALIEDQGITIAQFVPSLLQMLLHSSDAQPLGCRYIFCGGEPLSPELVRRAQAFVAGEVVNLYGPTEATIDATAWTCTEVTATSSIPIGRPIANTSVYLLDAHQQPVPVGVAGEIYIGGAGLARGYWNRPELTAERFLVDPFANAPNARMYRTGDMGRWRADGAIEYLGRNDHQVKIRGYRIEPGEIEAALLSHEAVQQAAVLIAPAQLVAYVVFSKERLQSNESEISSQELVREWEELHDSYASTGIGPSFVGWNSSYTGLPIAAAQMQEWLDTTLERIRALQPKRVLEIGCGVGLLVQGLAASCETYHGTDLSGAAVRTLRRWAAGQEQLTHVELSQRAATDFQGIAARSVDTIILNSVVQYFPDLDYLLAVLEQAVPAVADGGRIFLGDIRNLQLLEVFHRSVQIAKAAPGTTVEQIQARVHRALGQDKELVIAPEFFRRLQERIGRIGEVEIQLKRGWSDNELTRYRYDVILHVGLRRHCLEAATTTDYAGADSLRAWIAHFEQKRPPLARLCAIPNRRLWQDHEIEQRLEESQGQDTIDKVREALVLAKPEGEDPEAFWKLAQRCGYAVRVSWSGQDRDCFDVELMDSTRLRYVTVVAGDEHTEGGQQRNWRQYANEPLAAIWRRQWVPRLRSHLQARLPEHMVPAAFVVLDALPRLPNGKLDRKKLPQPGLSALPMREYQAPQGEIETKLAAVWQTLLQVERVGRHDHFFELGGHSLLAMQLISRVRQQLLAEIALTELFAHPRLDEFARRVAERLGRSIDTAPMVPIERNRPLPLSFAQQRLWFITQLDAAASAAYHIASGVRLIGRLDRDALQAALDGIVARHEVLRTRFEQSEGVPLQVIAPSMGLALHQQDLSEQPNAVAGLLAEEVRTPFNLSTGPLIRGRLIRLGADEHVLVLCMHHIVSDAWSMGVFLDELSLLYQAFVAGQSDPLPALSVQYADYAQWQRHWVSGERLQAQQRYWTEHLKGAPPLLELPSDHARPPVQSYAGAHVEVHLEADLTQALKALSRAHGATLYMTLLAGWAVLLARLSGQSDVVIGTPVANRNRAEIEGLIGFFVNTLALRIDLSDAPRVSELLERIKTITLQGQSHQDIPFEQVVEALSPQRSLAHSPVFQVLFSWQNTPIGELRLGELQLQSLPLPNDTTQFDLSLSLQEAGEEVRGELSYATALFAAATIERYLQYWKRLLQAMAADARQSIDRLPLLGKDERQLLLRTWNATRAEYPRDCCIHQLFEAQVAKTPDAIALVCAEQSLSYQELNAKANQLAHRLRSLGVSPDVRVALCIERNLEMVIGVLAVLKAGGAYVPLDPTYPQERLAYLLQDSAPVVLLTQAALADRWESSAAEFSVLLLDQPHAWTNQAETGLDIAETGLTSRHLAYVIYTSGSTGRPKGVMVEHRNVVRLFACTQDLYRFDADDVWTLFHSYAFDFSVWEIWGALLNGGRLVMVPQQTARSPEEFYALLCRHSVTILNQTPSAFRQLLNAQAQSSARHRLRQVIFGGEALEVATLKPWYAQNEAQQTQLVNMYGITETTVHVTYRPLEPADTQLCGRNPIGARLPDLRVYLLDRHQQPVPIGVAGEIYVGGAGVARGYLNHPELTAERFVNDPFAEEPAARMYRSGDLGRYLPNGEIEFLGRTDFQVKIRGFRIELGEIEARLTEHAGVREAVVLAREDVPGEKRLVAYYTLSSPQPAQEVSAAELREHLSRQLPEYMVPAAYERLDTLPLTVNGKLDRAALPVPQAGAYAACGYEAPAGEIETLLAQSWAQVLGVERVGRHDNFFALGGHSFLAVKLIERMRRVGLQADVRALFMMPTLSALAAAVRGGGEALVEVPPNLIEPGCAAITPGMLPLVQLTAEQIERIVASVPGGVSNIQDIYPLAPLQEGILFHHLMSSGGDPYLLQALLSFDTRERLNEFLRALQAVIDRHDILRTAVLWEDLPEPVQVVWRHAPLSMEEVQIDEQGAAAIEQLRVQVDPRQYRLDVRTAPMMHMLIARDQRNERWLLMWLMHHLVDDNTSQRLMLDEVKAYSRSEQQQLPASIPFRNFIAQARLGVAREQHEVFFRELLGDVHETTAPFGLLDVQGDGTRVEQAVEPIDAELAGRLRSCARALSVSAASIFHVIFAQVLAQVSGREDVVFGSVLFGRMQGTQGTDRALGLFINTLPVRIRVGEQGAADSVRAAHALLAQLLRHEHASLVLAQRCSGVAAPAPLFSALLNYRHGVDESPDQAVQLIEGSVLLESRERTNYPFCVSVDDLGEGFTLTAQVQAPMNPQRVCAYLQVALQGLVEALEQTPHIPLRSLEVRPPAERNQTSDGIPLLSVGLDVDDLGEEFALTAQVQASIDPQRICAYMETALYGLVHVLEQAPHTPLRDVPVLPESERRRMLVEWNATNAAYPEKSCVHELFEAQVRRMPQATAVVHESKALSYGELNDSANRLAHHLRELGVRPDIRVAICVERSPEMLVGLLAILKAGGAYVPLDPSHPPERLAYMLNDSAAVAALTHGAVNDTAREALSAVPVIDLQADVDRWCEHSTANPLREQIELAPEHLAYVIYTSGSTGQPKGVMVEHRSLVNQVTALQRRYELSDCDRMLQFAAITFDMSIEEIFGALSSGAALLLRTDAWLASADDFVALCHEYAVTVANLPPVFWQAIAQEQQTQLPTTLRQIMIGGDAVSVGAVAAWFKRKGHRPKLLNAYGPTEATVNAAIHELTPDSSTWRAIGRPLTNTHIYVLDRYGAPVPMEIGGEIYIGGVGVARGYLNRPDLTAERFVVDPFAASPGARMYRTGDLGRWLLDGTIDFLGRSDFQVKLRGFRIELGEIEARLTEHAGVRHAVAAAREDALGEKRLVAYYTLTSPQLTEQVGAAELREHLSQHLPEYMMPAAYVRLDSLPLTVNGKLDRAALPAPQANAYAAHGYEAPAGKIETLLAQLWAQVLGVERVGRHDNFFALGGHSLLAVRMISRVRQQLGVEVKLARLFAGAKLSEFTQTVQQAASSTLPAITRAARDEALPLSFAQQRLWFLAQMEGVSETYHISLGLRLSGRLDRIALRRALDQLVARHESLRTTFEMMDGEPVQRIGSAHSGFALLEQDLRDRPGRLAERIEQETQAKFDLQAGPLIRGCLIHLEEDEHALLITMHHIVSDGWSMGVLIRELSVLYAAYGRGESDPLAKLSIQYADYALWQRRWLSGEVLEEQSRYWCDRLAGAPVRLELPTDRPRPAQQNYAGDWVELQLDESLTAGLQALSQRHGMTMFMTVLAGWALLLSRLSGQQDVVIGTAVANRNRLEIEPLIGFFVNTLALRVDLRGELSCRELLQRVKECVLQAQQHQDLPFEQVVEIVQPPRSLAHSPVFQVMLTWQNTEPQTLQSFSKSQLDLPQLHVAALPGSFATAKHDLALTLGEVNGRIEGGLEFATALFERSTIERYAEYLRAALTQMVADEQRAIECIKLLSVEERQRLLVEWNTTTATYPEHSCVHELFEAQVRRTPQATAVVYEWQAPSYEELNERANRLAHYLRSLGVQPDVRVAICVERSLEMVIGLLAILKAGGVYVPLDPSYPPDRLVYLLGDSAPLAVLTHGAVSEAVRAVLSAMPLIDLQADADHWSQCSTANPSREEIELAPEHLAYVIYTSGSTGQPKGVMVEHRGVTNYLYWAARTYVPDRGAIVSSSYCFDGTVTSLWTPLIHGSAVHLLSEQEEFDRLAEQLQSPTCGLLKITPTYLDMLGQRLLAHGVRGSGGIFVIGGEALPAATIRLWRQIRSDARFINEYGPTETVVGCVAYEIPQEADSASSIPIGRPIANTRIYILDRHGEPVPTGVVGEIYIGGTGVTRGYLNRPGLTAERFIADRFASAPGARMYRTGDLGRYLANGKIEFIGRNDFQVKVRGFRIELGEIEARLTEHAGVREAVLLAARENMPGEKRLVAYYTLTAPQRAEEVSAVELREHLSRCLPQYMVPAAYVRLESLPLTVNGKLDRAALPAPEADAYAAHGYAAPEGEIETLLAQLWTQVLAVERIGRHDDFFDLGGHSLLILRVIHLLSKVGISIAASDVFKYPTPQSLAAYIEQKQSSVPADSAIPIRTTGEQTPLFLVHDQYGLNIYFSVLAAQLDSDIPVFGLPAVPLDRPQLQTLADLAARHVRLIQSVQPTGPYRLAGWSFAGLVAFEIAQQLLLQEERVEFVGLLDTYCPSASDSSHEPQRHVYSPHEHSALADSSDREIGQYVARHMAHLTAAERYVVRPISIPIHLFMARDNSSPAEYGSLLGWRGVLGSRCIETIEVAGDHFSMMEQPHVATLGKAIATALASSCGCLSHHHEKSAATAAHLA